MPHVRCGEHHRWYPLQNMHVHSKENEKYTTGSLMRTWWLKGGAR